MKTLQNNFTTIEQSKRLLKLGVPADSADCYINLWDNYPYGILAEDQSYSDYKFAGYMNDPKVLPCWSVGRLIEIYEIVGVNAGQCVTTTKGTSRLENLVQLYEENAILLDFSKLEE